LVVGASTRAGGTSRISGTTISGAVPERRSRQMVLASASPWLRKWQGYRRVVGCVGTFLIAPSAVQMVQQFGQ